MPRMRLEAMRSDHAASWARWAGGIGAGWACRSSVLRLNRFVRPDPLLPGHLAGTHGTPDDGPRLLVTIPGHCLAWTLVRVRPRIHGLTTSTPVSLKSSTLRVAIRAPRARAVAAIIASAMLMGEPEARRVAWMAA